MPVKADKWIEKMARERGMIEPFEKAQVRRGVSFGLSAYGYDFRLDSKFKLPVFGKNAVMDPKAAEGVSWKTLEGPVCEIPPNSYLLGQSLEYFRIPRNILTFCAGKSTYARCGLFVNVTPFEPEWEGFATLAIANLSPVPVRIHAGEGIAQLVFLESDEICAVSYADKKGKYQAQKEITGAKI